MTDRTDICKTSESSRCFLPSFPSLSGPRGPVKHCLQPSADVFSTESALPRGRWPGRTLDPECYLYHSPHPHQMAAVLPQTMEQISPWNVGLRLKIRTFAIRGQCSLINSSNKQVDSKHHWTTCFMCLCQPVKHKWWIEYKSLGFVLQNVLSRNLEKFCVAS